MLLVQATVRLAHAFGQAVVEVADGLPAVLVVLVGLDGDAGERSVAGDVVRLAQHAVARGEAALEEFPQLDLAARGGERVEVHVVDVDVALAVRACELRLDDAHLVELLGRLAAVLEHGAHRGVGVDVGVLALHVRIGGFGERDVLERLDEAAVHVAGTAALGAVEDVGLRRLDEALLDKRLLHEVLHALHRGHALDGPALQLVDHFLRDLVGSRAILHGTARLKRAPHRLGDLVLPELRPATVALDDGGDHAEASSLPSFPGHAVLCVRTVGLPWLQPRFPPVFTLVFHYMLWFCLESALIYGSGPFDRKQALKLLQI